MLAEHQFVAALTERRVQTSQAVCAHTRLPSRLSTNIVQYEVNMYRFPHVM